MSDFFKKSFLPCLTVFASLSLTAKAKRPHVVLLVSDDMSWNDVGYHGSRVKTPNIDRLTKEGVQLDRFYVHPICSPTRVALMTARSPARCGVTGPMGRDQGVPVEERFLPQAFQKAGYQTFMVGKWHLGHSREGYRPLARGFDHFYGFLGGSVDYYTHMGPRRVDWQRNGKTVEEEGYTTDLLEAEAIRLLKNRDKDRPVFLYLPFNAAHSPFQAPQALIQKYRELGISGREVSRFACIDALDQAIGRVLAALEKEGMAKDTLVMFFSDNGGGGGRRPLRGPARGNDGQSLALRGGKGSVLEGGIRVPAVIRWPGVIQAGSTSQQLLSALDLFPTLATAAGIPHGIEQPLDGEDLWAAIRANKTMPRKPVVVAGQSGEYALLQDQWKLIWDQGEFNLYDLVKDPTESSDLAHDSPEIVTRLDAFLEPFKKFKSTGGPPSRRGPPRGPGGGRRPNRPAP